jgi:hypothetical protein
VCVSSLYDCLSSRRWLHSDEPITAETAKALRDEIREKVIEIRRKHVAKLQVEYERLLLQNERLMKEAIAIFKQRKRAEKIQRGEPVPPEEEDKELTPEEMAELEAEIDKMDPL